MSMRYLAAAALIVIGIGSSVRAQEAGDPRNGLTAARQNCAACHAVEKEEARSPKKNAPTFAAIAATPGMTAAALGSALHTSHRDRTMPHLILSPDDLRNIVAYILSLK
jgi:mono/diheme cytochrome c family protein